MLQVHTATIMHVQDLPLNLRCKMVITNQVIPPMHPAVYYPPPLLLHSSSQSHKPDSLPRLSSSRLERQERILQTVQEAPQLQWSPLSDIIIPVKAVIQNDGLGANPNLLYIATTLVCKPMQGGFVNIPVTELVERNTAYLTR